MRVFLEFGSGVTPEIMKCRLGVCASRNCERLVKNFALTKDCAGGTDDTKSANDYSRYGRVVIVGRGLGAGVPLGVGVGRGVGVGVGVGVAVAGFFDSPAQRPSATSLLQNVTVA